MDELFRDQLAVYLKDRATQCPNASKLRALGHCEQILKVIIHTNTGVIKIVFINN